MLTLANRLPPPAYAKVLDADRSNDGNAKPTDPAEFEKVVSEAMQLKWETPRLQRNGRPDQKQDGVDIFGADASATTFAPLACAAATLPCCSIQSPICWISGWSQPRFVRSR